MCMGKKETRKQHKQDEQVMRFVSRTIMLRSLIVAIVCGLLLSLVTGLVENPPEEVSIMRFKYYGHPLAWRVIDIFGPTEYKFDSLAIDAAFWITISFLAVIILKMLKLRIGFKYETLLLPLVLFIPLSLVMDFVHEFGHAMWGVATGGRLTYMKITYFEIYPRLAITPQFDLGEVHVIWAGQSLPAFEYGLFLLGGSLTTNIVSWLLALILLKISFGFKTKIALRILGLFGLLDLPLYVLFPQIGLHHWIFLGGCQPEPLIGARKMGIPDSAFCIMVVLSTLGLLFFYFKPFWKKVADRLKFFSE